MKITSTTSDESYDLIAIYSSTLANVGPIVDKLLVIELGLTWEPTQELLLNNRIDIHERNSFRKKTDIYKEERAIHRQKRKDETCVGIKDQDYKSTTKAKEIDLNYKNAVTQAKNPPILPLPHKFLPRDLVFVKFATIYHYGIIFLLVESDKYLIHFIDGEDSTQPYKELIQPTNMKENCKIWIPRANKKSSLLFTEFKELISQYDSLLLNFYDSQLI